MSKPIKDKLDKKTPTTSPALSPGQQQTIGMMLTQDMMRGWQTNFQTMLSTGFTQVQSELSQIKEQIKAQEKNLSGQQLKEGNEKND